MMLGFLRLVLLPANPTLSDRYCKHPTLSAVESKKAGRRLFTLSALEINYRETDLEYFYMCLVINPIQYLFMRSTLEGKKKSALTSHTNKYKIICPINYP